MESISEWITCKCVSEWATRGLEIVRDPAYIYPALLGLALLVIFFIFQSQFGVTSAVPASCLTIAAIVAPWVVKHSQPYYLSCAYWETAEPYIVVGSAILIFFLYNFIVPRYA